MWGGGSLAWAGHVSGCAAEGGGKREGTSCSRSGEVELWCVCAVRGGGEKLFGTSSGVGSQQGGCLFGCEAGRRATCAVVRWGFAKRELLGVTVRCAWGHVDTLCLWCARRWGGGSSLWACDVSGSAAEGGGKRERTSWGRHGAVELKCVCGVCGAERGGFGMGV